MLRAQVQTLVRELRSHKPHGVAKKKKRLDLLPLSTTVSSTGMMQRRDIKICKAPESTGLLHYSPFIKLPNENKEMCKMILSSQAEATHTKTDCKALYLLSAGVGPASQIGSNLPLPHLLLYQILSILLL